MPRFAQDIAAGLAPGWQGVTPHGAERGHGQNRHLGTVLVGLQFGLIVGIAVLAWPAVTAGTVPAAAWVAAVGGGLLGAWALQSHPRGNFHIRPTPREGGRTVSHGPYRWFRRR